MESDELQELIDQGESLRVEFKSELDDRELVEETTAFANSDGGVLLIGVRDNGEILGAAARHGSSTDCGRVEALVRNRTEPPLNVTVSEVEIDGRRVLVVEILVAASVIGTTTGVYKRRVIGPDGKPEVIAMRPHDIVGRAGSLGVVDRSEAPLPDADSARDLDLNEIDRFRAMARAQGDAVAELPDSELLRALRFLDLDDRLTIGAVLFFGTEQALERWLPNYEVAWQELEALEIRMAGRARIPILRALAELEVWIQARNPQEEIEVGLIRHPLPRFSTSAVRELVVNALVHRDYAAKGATLVEINQDGLSISNPGGFPTGVTVHNLLHTPPQPRNPAIADACKRVGVGDRVSRGINRAYESQLLSGRPAPDYTGSNAARVTVTLSSAPADRELARLFVERTQAGAELNINDLLALYEIRRAGRIATSRAAELFQTDDGAARAVLNRLSEAGLVEPRGERKGRTYHLGRAYYDRLGDPSGYLRAKGFSEVQHREMIREFVRINGRIQRSEAAELCQLGPEAAGALLRRMRDDGELELRGERRGSHYVEPAGSDDRGTDN